MKTMMELLIRLQELQGCARRVAHNPHLTRIERATPGSLEKLVRDCLPTDVLKHYDRLKGTEPDLLRCPEVFAMAVIVATYKSLSPRKRQRLRIYFAMPPSVPWRGNGSACARSPRRKTRRAPAAANRMAVRN